MRILAVEDDRDWLEAIYRLLVFHHHDVTPARTLKDAVRLCIKDKFDLVVCDIGLPDGDGWELARIARESGCPAIAVTGYGMASDVEKARSAGFAEHLLKPYLIDDLLSAITRVVPGDSPAVPQGSRAKSTSDIAAEAECVGWLRSS